MSKYFPEPIFSRERVKVEFDLSNFVTKVDFKNTTGVDTSALAKNIDLANLKSGVNNLDIDKLENVPGGLSSLKSKVDKVNIEKLKTAPVDL